MGTCRGRPEGRAPPRGRLLLVGRFRETNADHEPPPRRLRREALHERRSDPRQGGEIAPLVVVGLKRCVHEHGVPLLTRLVLKRQRDEVPETTARHGVLVGEEPVVRPHAELMPPGHRLREEIAAHLPGEARRHRSREEEPDVSAVAGPGAFDGHRNVHCPAGLGKCPDIVLPGGLVEVNREEPAGLVFEQRVDPHDVTAPQMVEDHPVVDRRKGLVRALAALDLRKIADPAHELVRTGGRIAGLPGLLAQEPRREDVLATPEQSPEEPDLLCGRHRRREARRDRQDRWGWLIQGEGHQFCP